MYEVFVKTAANSWVLGPEPQENTGFRRFLAPGTPVFGSKQALRCARPMGADFLTFASHPKKHQLARGFCGWGGKGHTENLLNNASIRGFAGLGGVGHPPFAYVYDVFVKARSHICAVCIRVRRICKSAIPYLRRLHTCTRYL